MKHLPPLPYVLKHSTHYLTLKFKNFQNSDGIEGFTPIVNWYYQNYVMDNPMPQKPNYIFGLAKCMK